MQQPLPNNNNYNPQPSFNQNYMQQPMPNPKDITDPTTAMNITLVLMAKAFKLNYSTPTNNNQRISSNPRNRQITQPVQNVRNQVVQNAVQNPGVQNVGNQNGLIVVSRIANQNPNGNGNVVATRAEGNAIGNNADLDEIKKVNANCILMANLQQASTSEEQYTELLELIPEPHQVQQNDSNVISEVSSMKQDGGTLDQHPATVEEIRAYFESLYNNLAIEVEKFNSVNRKMKETNVDLTTELARYKNQERYFEINQEKYDKLERSSQIFRTSNPLQKKLRDSLAKHKALELEIKRLLRAVVSQDIMSIVQNNSLVDTSNLQTELEQYDKSYNDMQQKIEWLQAQLGDQKGKSKDTPYVPNTLDPLSQKLENENVELEFQVLNYAKENAHLKTTYKNLFDSISVTRTQTKTIIDSLQNKLHDTIYENAKLRAQLFDKVSEQKDTTHGTSTNTKFAKQSILGKPPSSSRPKLYVVTPLPKSKAIPKIDESHALSKPVTSNSVPTPQESKVVKNDNVIALGMFRINPFKASRVNNFVLDKHVKASVRTKSITISQPHVITKNDVNSKTNGFSPTDVKSTTRTRRPQPRNNPKNDKVPSKSKSSWISNNLEKIEENHRNLQSSSNQKHMSSECNNIKLAIRNAKSKVVCAMCKKCLITANHDVCVLNYVNDMNSRALNKKAHVSNVENQKKHRPKVWKPKKSWKVYSVICSTNYSNGENQVASKSFAVTTDDASDKRHQQQDSTSSTSTLATTITADGNFDLVILFSIHSDEWKSFQSQHQTALRAAVEDSSLAREINGLCAGLTARIEERGYFIDELDTLVDRFMPE
ncbi:hypothetical protein Tco_0925175 [Tanacetum coccineum]|uniref:Uncharacterized protein n=1 Tax=Tanacetum coccineum TaxID=301880 RepID=A0ABQ5D916_9ASTR